VATWPAVFAKSKVPVRVPEAVPLVVAVKELAVPELFAASCITYAGVAPEAAVLTTVAIIPKVDPLMAAASPCKVFCVNVWLPPEPVVMFKLVKPGIAVVVLE
jgi:hypothetical protein